MAERVILVTGPAHTAASWPATQFPGDGRGWHCGPMKRSLAVVDVFGAEAGRGNPVAVVLDGEGLDTAQMQQFARWMNLSETTFVLPPSGSGADYRVRIFTPAAELPFAGHPTLGTCHAWLAASRTPQRPDVVVPATLEFLAGLRVSDGWAGSRA